MRDSHKVKLPASGKTSQWLWPVVGATVVLSGCGGGGGGGSSSKSEPVIVTAAASSPSVSVGATDKLNASVENAGSNTGVTWAVAPGSSGSVAQDGTYTAPAVAGSYSVTATSVADSSKYATVPITVTVVVSVAPATTSVSVLRSKTFTAGVAGATNQGVTWSVKPGGVGGTISQSGVYAAPAGVGTDTIVAVSAVDGNQKATATVTTQAASSSFSVQ